LGIPWRETVADLSQRDWQPLWDQVYREGVDLPANYRASFHGYDAGHLCWQAAYEFEVASNAVHSSLYPDAGAHSDQVLRQGYHERLQQQFPRAPARILDLHSTVGLSTFRLEQAFPTATVTGLDFSPYYLALAAYNAGQRGSAVQSWVHALPEATGFAAGSFDLVSAFLLFHEMPQTTTRRIFREVRRLLPPVGCFAVLGGQGEVVGRDFQARDGGRGKGLLPAEGAQPHGAVQIEDAGRGLREPLLQPFALALPQHLFSVGPRVEIEAGVHRM